MINVASRPGWLTRICEYQEEAPLKDLPPSPEFDPRQAHHAVKSREGMLAFTGFQLAASSGATTEGILKISAQKTPYRGDTLILTFIIDADPGQLDKAQLEAHFDRISTSIPSRDMGSNFERFNLACLDCIGGLPRWFVMELKIFYRTVIDQKKTLLERDVLPYLGKTLNCRFQSLEWWPQTRSAVGGEPTPDWIERPGWKPLQSLLKWWREN
jgi:hypothetical protein